MVLVAVDEGLVNGGAVAADAADAAAAASLVRKREVSEEPIRRLRSTPIPS